MVFEGGGVFPQSREGGDRRGAIFHRADVFIRQGDTEGLRTRGGLAAAGVAAGDTAGGVSRYAEEGAGGEAGLRDELPVADNGRPERLSARAMEDGRVLYRWGMPQGGRCAGLPVVQDGGRGWA